MVNTPTHGMERGHTSPHHAYGAVGNALLHLCLVAVWLDTRSNSGANTYILLKIPLMLSSSGSPYPTRWAVGVRDHSLDLFRVKKPPLWEENRRFGHKRRLSAGQ